MSKSIQSGELIANRFEIVRFIAEGAMGEVYEAIDKVLGGRVALKFLNRHIVDDERVQRRFRREIQLARQVTHANVCRLFDVYQHHVERGLRPDIDVLFVTMELLDGQTLESYLTSRAPLSEEEALPLVRQMAEGLAAAHAAGVIHRDFKPSNVMLVGGKDDSEFRAVVTDFGLARSILPSNTSASPLTGEMRVVGTADYMSPEQLRGQEVTPASDIYAFGVVIFEMVTGAKPYDAPDAMALLTKRATQPPSLPRDHKPDLNPGWASVIESCLELDPASRPATIREVAIFLGGGSGDLTQSMIPRPDWAQQPPRRRLQEWGPVFLLLAVVLAAAVAVWSWRGPRHEPPSSTFARGAQLTTEDGLEMDPAFSPDSQSLVYASNESGAFEIYVRDLTPGGGKRQLTADGSQNFEPAFSPDGKWVAFHSLSRGGLWKVTIAGETARQLTVDGSRPAFSPDGEWIAYQSESAPLLSATTVPALGHSTLRLVTAEGKARRQLTRPGSPPGGHGAPAFSPNGEWIAFSTSRRGSSEIWAIRRDGSALVRLVDEPTSSYDPVYSEDGRYLFFSGAVRQVYGLWRLPLAADGTPAGAAEEVKHLGVASLRLAAFSPDGSRLAYAAFLTRSNLYTLPVSPAGEVLGQAVPLTTGNSRNTRPAFAADGERLSYDHWQLGSNADIWVSAADGTDKTQVTLDSGHETVSSWYPGGEWLTYVKPQGDQRIIHAVNVASGEIEIVATLEVDADWARLAPDGLTLAYHTRAGDITINIHLLDLATGRKQQLTFDDNLAGFPCWSSDGRWLTFQVQRDGGRHVYVMASDGSAEPVPLVERQDRNWPYSFSPDSDKVAFVSDRDGFWNVYWVSKTSGEERQLTEYALLNAYLRYPAWSPQGDQIVFELAENAGDIFVAERE